MSYEDHLAYGEYHGEGSESETDRGFLGDVFRKIRGKNQSQDEPTHSSQPSFNPQGSSSSPNPSGAGGMSFVFDKLNQAVHDIKQRINVELEKHSHTHASGTCTIGMHDHHRDNRFFSFAPQRSGNEIKWYVDACGYMWAVSVALEQARESIWILDWWLSPELYLRRPPAKFEQYRVDRMLQAAAERGVKVNIIVYKEVTQALTRKLLNPVLPDYLHSLLPHSTDFATRFLTRVGLDVTFAALEEAERSDPLIAPPISVSSWHTKHALEALHPNIAVFRHPDHLPDAQNLQSSFASQFHGQSLTAAALSKLPGEALQALYGSNESTVLYWAHHEKLCLVDGHIAFMGGLDLCYGRWDTNQHSIADVHPGNLKDIVFPGQDYNNARIMDFQDVAHWQNNKLDRTESSRMGWSDVSLCLSGPSVWDLKNHFIQRWNFIYNEKYDVLKDTRYSRLTLENQPPYPTGPSGSYGDQSQFYPPPPQGYSSSEVDENARSGRSRIQEEIDRPLFETRGSGAITDRIRNRFAEEKDKVENRIGRHHQHPMPTSPAHYSEPAPVGTELQLTRSCTKWSNGTSLEHSIANAYIETIRDSEHFVYIENQFFITATGDNQSPVRNRIGAAIVERIVRAARQGQKFMMIVMIPAIPAFAGDLRSDDALSTRAIMEFQYRSINRGHGYSIYELIAKEGVNPLQYIRFYNLRNYDRINASKAMQEVEQKSGVTYEEARKQYDDNYGGGFAGNPDQQKYGNQPVVGPEGAYGPGGMPGDGGYSAGYGDKPQYGANDPYRRYQESAKQIGDFGGLGSGRWDTVSECYMLGGEDIRNVPWENGDMDEIDAFVSEELYIHTKLLIADDRVVICGSANLNDRSQVGDHDSEIAVVVQDPTPVDSYMNGQPYRASKFAASLRRQLFRKHLGLLKPQDMTRPDDNFMPIGVGNTYDWGTEEDQAVMDPLSDQFLQMWFQRAKSNTDAFAKVFHPVPFDGVRTWKEYDDYYERFFKQEEKEKAGQKPSMYKWGHVVAEDFPGGVQQVKEVLSTIRGNLVEMPLLFLNNEDIAKEGLSLNAFTEEVYT